MRIEIIENYLGKSDLCEDWKIAAIGESIVRWGMQ
jgi:hypothetical protein